MGILYLKLNGGAYLIGEKGLYVGLVELGLGGHPLYRLPYIRQASEHGNH